MLQFVSSAKKIQRSVSMKILLFGAGGQLGRAICESQFLSSFDMITFDKTQADITDLNRLSDIFEKLHPDVVINAAAYTNVKEAESDIITAKLVNAKGPNYLAKLSKKFGAILIHFSTDYVFDGLKRRPYLEDDDVNPVNNYGRTKLAGEELIAAEAMQYYILRTSWVMGGVGNNFARTILNKAFIGEEIKIVEDQIGAPTSVDLLTKVVEDLISSVCHKLSWPSGIYHISPNGQTSWFELAKFIIELAIQNGLTIDPGLKLKPISTADLGSKVMRPEYSVLDTDKIENQLGFQIPCWKESLLPTVLKIIESVKNHE